MINEGTTKLASVPSGGGGGAAAAGDAAAGGAAAETKEEEKKEEGMCWLLDHSWLDANIWNREGRVRRGYGLRSLRLSGRLTWYGVALGFRHGVFVMRKEAVRSWADECVLKRENGRQLAFS